MARSTPLSTLQKRSFDQQEASRKEAQTTTDPSGRKRTDTRARYYISNGKLIDRQTNTSIRLSSVGGSTTEGIKAINTKLSGRSFGSVGDKFYTGVSQQEIINQRLKPFSGAREITSRSQQIKLVRSSSDRLNAGDGTSRDLLNYISGGTGRKELFRVEYKKDPNTGRVISFKTVKQKYALARSLASRNEAQRFRRDAYATLNAEQRAEYAKLSTRREKDDLLIQIVSRQYQPTQSISQPSQPSKPLKKGSVILTKLSRWANSINDRKKEAERKSALKDAKLLIENIARKEAIEQYAPTGFKTLSKGINAFVNLGVKSFKGLLDFGTILANGGEKMIFFIPTLGANIPKGSTVSFLKEFVAPEQRKVLKDIYSDPKTYRDALVGAGIMLILGGIKAGKLTAKNVKKLPKRTIKYAPRTILKDVNNNVAYVSRSGFVKPIPKGFRTLTRSLTRPFSEFVTRRVIVTRFPKTSTLKIGTILQEKGNIRSIRIVSKNGKVVKPTARQALKISEASAKGAKIRVKRTEVARATKKVAKAPSKKAGKIIRRSEANKLNVKITKETNRFIKRYKIQKSDVKEFTKAYKNFRKKPTNSNIAKLKKISDRAEVDEAVRAIDRIIIRRMPKKGKPTTKEINQTTKDPRAFLKDRGIKIKEVSDKEMFNQIIKSKALRKIALKEVKATGSAKIPYGTTDGKTVWLLKGKYKGGWTKLKVLKHEAIHILKSDVRSIQKSNFPTLKRFAVEKRTELMTKLKSTKFPLKKKIKITKPKQKLTAKQRLKLQKEKGTAERFQSSLKADQLARKQGFKNYQEQFKYNEAFKKYKLGNKSAGKTIKIIEKALSKRASKASKLRYKQMKASRQDAVDQAVKLLKEGRLKIREKKYQITAKKKPMPKDEAESLLLSIKARQGRISDAKYKRQAKQALREIIEGKQVSTSDPKLNSAIRKLINNEQLKLLRLEKRIRIQKGLVKGKQPKTRLTRTTKKTIKATSKEQTRLDRIARKKIKRSPAGGKQARKIYRKRLIEELRGEEQLLARFARDPKVQRNYTLDLTKGRARLIPKKSIKTNKVKFARDIIKSKKPPKGQKVKVNQDGTIQLLETKRVQVASKKNPLEAIGIKKAELKKIWKQVAKKKAVATRKPTTISKLARKPAGIKKGAIKVKVIKATSVSRAVAFATAVILSTAKATSRLRAQAQAKGATKAQIKAVDAKVDVAVKKLSLIKSDLKVYQAVATSQAQAKALDKAQASTSKLITKLKTIPRKPPKKPTPKKPTPKILPLAKLKWNWGKSLPVGYKYRVDGYIKIGKRYFKLVSGVPQNIGWNKVFSRGSRKYRSVDKSLARSFELRITGVTRAKDDARRIGIKKVRTRVGTDPRVLQIVEKSKYAIDSYGEKAGLRSARASRK